MSIIFKQIYIHMFTFSCCSFEFFVFIFNSFFRHIFNILNAFESVVFIWANSEVLYSKNYLHKYHEKFIDAKQLFHCLEIQFVLSFTYVNIEWTFETIHSYIGSKLSWFFFKKNE